MNTLLFFITILLNFSLMLVFYRMFGKTGLFAWVGISTIICNIEVLKTIELFGMITTLGNVMYGSIFLATDILGEKYGRKEGQKAVIIGFVSLIAFTLIMQVNLMYIPHTSDFASPHLEALFSILPRIAIASLTAYIISQIIDTYLYDLLKNRFKKPWVSTNISTLISQSIDTTIFTAVAFIGVFPNDVLISIWVSTFVLKFIITIMGTPFLYASLKIKSK